MVDFQLIASIIFVILLGFLAYKNRKQLKLQRLLFPVFYILLWPSKWGIKTMDKVSQNHRKLIIVLGFFGIIIGFAGMAFIAVLLIDNLWKLLTVPTTIPGVKLVFPVKSKLTFYIPFLYWIVSIAIIAIVHEFSHGVMARAFGMKIKSTGFALAAVIVPIIPAAYVEPNEKEMAKRPLRQQLSVFAAGPVSNIVLGFAVLAILLLTFDPVASALYKNNGVEVTGLTEGNHSAEKAGIRPGERITYIDGIPTNDAAMFTNLLASKKPGQEIEITTNRSIHKVILSKNPGNQSKAYLGVYIAQATVLKPEAKKNYGEILPDVIMWFYGLLYLLFALNLGVGLFNLLPLGIVDGGRMTLSVLQKYFKKDKAHKYWKYISSFYLMLILVILAFNFIR
jgi:membrane-associated protease RseP (regulator of RpoE activity)